MPQFYYCILCLHFLLTMAFAIHYTLIPPKNRLMNTFDPVHIAVSIPVFMVNCCDFFLGCLVFVRLLYPFHTDS